MADHAGDFWLVDNFKLNVDPKRQDPKVARHYFRMKDDVEKQARRVEPVRDHLQGRHRQAGHQRPARQRRDRGRADQGQDPAAIGRGGDSLPRGLVETVELTVDVFAACGLAFAASAPCTAGFDANAKPQAGSGSLWMPALANLNGQIMPLEEVKVSALDRGFLFGDAVYEVMRIYQGGRIWRRSTSSAWRAAWRRSASTASTWPGCGGACTRRSRPGRFARRCSTCRSPAARRCRASTPSPSRRRRWSCSGSRSTTTARPPSSAHRRRRHHAPRPALAPLRHQIDQPARQRARQPGRPRSRLQRGPALSARRHASPRRRTAASSGCSTARSAPRRASDNILPGITRSLVLRLGEPGRRQHARKPPAPRRSAPSSTSCS